MAVNHTMLRPWSQRSQSRSGSRSQSGSNSRTSRTSWSGWCRVAFAFLVQLVVGATDASSEPEAGLAGATTEAFTYRVLLSESARQSCPFAREPDSPQSIAFWKNTYGDAMVSLSAVDEVLSARDMYDVLDGIGSILTCCPGLLQNPAAVPASSNSNSNSVPPLPSCGLLRVSTDSSGSPYAVAGGDRNPYNIGYELTLAFSSTLRAARLPAVALEALHDAAGLAMTSKQRAGWDTEMALVFLQMGRVGEAVSRLKSALKWDPGDLRVLQPLGAALVAQGKVAKGFAFLRTAADVQRSRVAYLFADIVRDQGLDPSVLDYNNEKEVLVTQRNWMATYLGRALQGRWKELGDSVHVLRRVDGFLEGNLSADSEISFMLGRELSKRGFQGESSDFLTTAAAPWNRQIYRIRSALSIPVVASSEQDLELVLAALERWLRRQQPAVDAPRQGSSGGGGSSNGGFERPLSSCSFGALNYPDVAFDNLPLLAFGDHRFPRRRLLDRSSGDYRRSTTTTVPADVEEEDLDDDEELTESSESVLGKGDADMVSPYGPIGRLFLRLCPDLGAYVAPWLLPYSGGASLAPGRHGGRLGAADGRVRVVFVSSRFGNHGTTKALAPLMRLLPRQHFEVILGSWPTPSDEWTEEHVLRNTESRPVNLVFNRTSSLQKLANRRADVVVFADAPLDSKSYFLSFGRVAPVQIALWGQAPTLGIGSIDYYVVPEPLVAAAWRGDEEETQRGPDPGGEEYPEGGAGNHPCGGTTACTSPELSTTTTTRGLAGKPREGEELGEVEASLKGAQRRRSEEPRRRLSRVPAAAGGGAGGGAGGNTGGSAGGTSRLRLGVAAAAPANLAAEKLEGIPPVPVDGLEGTEGAPEHQHGRGEPSHGDDYYSGDGKVDCSGGGARCGGASSARPLRQEDLGGNLVVGPDRITGDGDSIGDTKIAHSANGVRVGAEGFDDDDDDDDFDDDDDDDDDFDDLVYERMPFGDAFDGVYDDAYDDDIMDGDEAELFFGHHHRGDHPQEEKEEERKIRTSDVSDDCFEEHDQPSEDGGISDADWPSPQASVGYAETVEEQVVFLESLGAFVQPPGWGGRLGTGRLARLAGAAEVRRRHLLPETSRLAVLPIPVYHFHPHFDAAVGMLLGRHPSIHVVVAVEETAAESLRTEGEFYQHDHLQYASPPVWTEKLRSRLAARLGDDIWRVHLLPPLDSWDYFAILGVANVVLDPFPVGNLHAAVDAFALGSPVVTLPSRQRAGARYVQALASDLGVPASYCAAANVVQYVDLAARLCLDDRLAEEVSDVLYNLRDWVYLHPKAPRTRQRQQQQQQQQEGQCSIGQWPGQEEATANHGGDSHATASRSPNTAERSGGGGGRRRSAWGRGERHVQEWAEFLWRVARPGVPLEFPLKIQREQQHKVRRNIGSNNGKCAAGGGAGGGGGGGGGHKGQGGGGSNTCSSCSARRKAAAVCEASRPV